MVGRKSYFFKKNTRSYKWFQTIIIILVIIGVSCGIKSIFSKSSKIHGFIKTAKDLTLQGNFDGAMEEFNKAVNLNPEEPLIYDGMGFLYVNKGDFDLARENYTKARSKGLKFNGLFDHKKFGNDYISKGKYACSLVEFEHYNQLKPYDVNGMFALGLSYHGLGQTKNAIANYDKALNLSPKNSKIQSYMDKARKEKDTGTMGCIFDRNLDPLLKKNINKNISVYPAEGYTDKIIGYYDEKYIKLGLEDKLKDYIPGNEIILTLDLNMQKIASSTLYDKVGSVVILKPQTGEILAAVSHPKFDPNKMDKNWSKYKYNKNNVFLNRAFESLYEPGSICKIITSSAILESQISMKDIFPVKCNGSLTIDGQSFWCWEKHNSVKNLEQAIDQSCNIAFAKLGIALGNDKLYESANKFGFNMPLEMQLPISTSTFTSEIESKFELAERANGLGKNYRITPLHAAMLAATVANGGTLMKPYLVKEIKNIKGETIYKEEPTALRTTLKKETAEALKKLMIDAVEHGLGKKAKVDGITVAGKTGTAKTGKVGLDGWFICFAPAEKPELAIAILCEKGGKGMDVAAPIAKLIISEILKGNK